MIFVLLGLVGDDGRIQLMYNQFGTIIAMTHILLPFMILPLYSVMKTIPKDFVRAARSLGATPTTAFVKVYFPQTVPGIGAGVLLVFILAIPFVIITVTATLVGFDHSLTRAAASLGATPPTIFRQIILPLILPGVISGALFAFVTSFDEVVVLSVASFDQHTIPLQMWNGIREQISPTILAVATILVIFSIALLTTIEILRRRAERLRGISPG